jgi:hypothetical protein
MTNVIKAFAKKSGKSEDEVKDALETTQETVAADNPEIDVDSKTFYKLVIGELRKMLSIKSENEGADMGGIKYSDVSPGTTTGLTRYHTKKRQLKRTVAEAIDKLSSMSKADLKAFDVLQSERSELSISMIESAISTDQLKESVSSIEPGQHVITSESETMLYLDSAIKQAVAEKQNFATFVETFASHLLGGSNLNEDGFEYPGYDIQADGTFVSVKSSTSRHTVSEAYRNSNSVKNSALILSALYRMDPSTFKENASFKDITQLLEFKDQLLEFVHGEDSKVSFVVSYVNKANEFKIHATSPVQETTVLEHCFDVIENATGKAKSKFFASFSKLVEFCGGQEVTTVSLMDDSEYASLREDIIETIANIKDYNLMRKISMLLK